MRIISQNGTTNVPYEQCIIHRIGKKIYFVSNNLVGVLLPVSDMEMASYSTEEKAQKAMEMLRLASAGVLVAKNVPDDKLKELMKYGAVTVEDTDDIRVEHNGYFQFPKDEDVEV